MSTDTDLTTGQAASAPAKSLFPGIKGLKKRKWLTAIAETGKIRAAEKLTGINHASHYAWLKKDSAYKQAYDEAMDRATDLAIDECFRRGVEGIEKALSYQGKLTGYTIREYSDNLLMFFIKARRPEFRDSWPAQNTTGPISFNVCDRQRANSCKKQRRLACGKPAHGIAKRKGSGQWELIRSLRRRPSPLADLFNAASKNEKRALEVGPPGG